MKLEPRKKNTNTVYEHIYMEFRNDNNDSICETAQETQMYRTDFWTLWEKARVGRSERIALKHVYYHI